MQERELLTLEVYAVEVLCTCFPLVSGKNEKDLNFYSVVLEDTMQKTDRFHIRPEGFLRSEVYLYSLYC